MKRKKWASDIALENFDQFYKPLYGDRWPSIRLALLCQHKYCAFVNNYSDTEKAESVLQNAGAYNIRSQFNSRYKYVTRLLEDGNVSDIDANVEEDHSEPEYDVEESYEPVNDEVDDDVTARFASSAKYETANFNEFVPATRLKGLEDWVDESDQFSACNTKEEFTFQTIDEKPKALPWRWKIYCFKRGDVSTFPPPRYNKPDLLGMCTVVV